VFTSELDRLRPKDERMDEDEDVEEGSSESVSSFEDDGVEKKRRGRDEYPDEFEDSEEEKEDYTIRKTDALIVAATAEDDHSNLEVYIYDHKTSDLYVHHEIILSSYPLCMEWLSTHRSERVNYVVVGTFLPEIEIWNLDKEDCEPIYTLGGLSQDQLKDKKKKKKTLSSLAKPEKVAIGSHSETTHTDAVMSLSLNPFQSEYLASGSADNTVKIWDLEELQCKANLANLHKNKVQLVRWNLKNEQLLLTGGYDRVVNVVDVRERPLGTASQKYRLKKEVKDLETGSWHPFSEHNFVLTTESGTVLGYDIRNPSASLFEFEAHEKACSNLSFSPHVPNLMATCSLDEYVKIWDIAAPEKPKLISYKKFASGELFSLSFYKDIPWVLAAGGSKGEVAVWDIEENETISKHFTPYLDKATVPEEDFDDEADQEDDSEEEEAKRRPQK
jgi:periodic tryptophan protein 1